MIQLADHAWMNSELMLCGVLQGGQRRPHAYTCNATNKPCMHRTDDDTTAPPRRAGSAVLVAPVLRRRAQHGPYTRHGYHMSLSLFMFSRTNTEGTETTSCLVTVMLVRTSDEHCLRTKYSGYEQANKYGIQVVIHLSDVYISKYLGF